MRQAVISDPTPSTGVETGRPTAYPAPKELATYTADQIPSCSPRKVWNDLDADEHNGEGRVVTAEFENFFLVNTYVPNSKGDLSRLPYRKTWDAYLLGYLKELEKTKPVFLCGDLNVAHQEIDLANPKSNYNKSPGYTQDEIDGIDNFILIEGKFKNFT